MKLIDAVVDFHTELQAIRRNIHAHPELCYEETRTSDLVAEKLTAWGFRFFAAWASPVWSG